MNAPINPIFQTREQYLTEATNLVINDLLVPIIEQFKGPGAEHVAIPHYRISVGFPKHSRGGKAIAVCHPKASSSDGVSEIFVTPEIDDPVEVLEAICHEVCHAADDCRSGHQHWFAFAARKLGLDGKLTKTYAGDKLKATLREYADLLGAFPHHAMQSDVGHKKDTTRQLKVSCDNHDCGFIFRTSASQIRKLGATGTAPCPACDDGYLDWDTK